MFPQPSVLTVSLVANIRRLNLCFPLVCLWRIYMDLLSFVPSASSTEPGTVSIEDLVC